MASLPRIMVVDSRHEISRAVRATLDLLDHRAIVIEIPSGEAALLEMQRAASDLLVCDFQLPGMNGVDLAARAVDERPGMGVIVIADIDDPVPGEDVLNQTPYTVLVKPVAADRLARAIRVGLGEELEEPEQPQAAAESLGPVPAVALDELRGIMSALLTDVGAMATVLIDRNGELLIELGAVGYLDREKLASVLKPSFASMAHIAGLVGGDPWGMYYWDGDQFDIYVLALGVHHFVCLVFDGSAGSRALGSVSIYGRRAIDEMLHVVGPAAFQTQPMAAPPKPARRPTAPPPKAAAPTPAPTPAKAARSAPPAPAPTPAATKPAPASVKPTPPRQAKPELKPAPPPPTVQVDDATLSKALNKLQNIDVDAFWDNASQQEKGAKEVMGSEDALTFEEALQLGLLPPELGPGE